MNGCCQARTIDKHLILLTGFILLLPHGFSLSPSLLSPQEAITMFKSLPAHMTKPVLPPSCLLLCSLLHLISSGNTVFLPAVFQMSLVFTVSWNIKFLHFFHFIRMTHFPLTVQIKKPLPTSRREESNPSPCYHCP